MTRRFVIALLVSALVVSRSARAAQDPAALTQPPGALPALTRDEAGHATIRAVRLTTPVRIDGRLDEAIYQTLPIDDFIQTMPKENGAPTERTQAWVFFDGTNFYVACRCWDSAPPDRWTANEMRRDTSQLRQNDNFGVALDTFHDRRNGFSFYTNPLGALADFAIADEGNPNTDWNPVWQVRTGRFEGGWTVEMAIPFKSLRYQSGTSQTWGIQIRRGIRRKNEWEHINPLPLSVGGPQGFFRVSAQADLVGLDLPAASRNMEVKPYGISRLLTDRAVNPALSNDLRGDFGVDAKYGITANLTADVTYNTDFAQVEVDEQQVNLTRFTLVLPEKREFFLENRGVFEFGRGGATGGTTGANTATTSLTPQLFYTRRIGLNRGRVVPIDVGGRVTGKVGGFNIGAINIQTGAMAAITSPPGEPVPSTPTTNFTVLRVKRDILRRSSIGALFANRSQSLVVPGTNQTYGADAAFSFFQDLHFGGFYSRTSTPGLTSDDASYQGRFEFAGDRYGARAEYLAIGDNFNPEVGFVRRDDIRRRFASLRFSPRSKSKRLVRRISTEASIEYIENGRGILESRQGSGLFSVEFENSDLFQIEGGPNYERLLRPFEVSQGVFIPPGRYPFSDMTASYGFGQQRPVSGTLALQAGQFYDGTIVAVSYTAARVAVTRRFSIEPTVSINRVELPAGQFTNEQYRARSDYAFSPRMFVSGLVQYSSADRAFSTNLRFRWEYRPGSEFFAVYTDERDTLTNGFPRLKNRAFVLKVNRLLRF